MHSSQLVHRDVRKDNVFIDSHYHLKLANFGFALEMDDNGSSSSHLTNKVTRLWYQSPELLVGAVNYSFGADVWGAGCILWEILRIRPIACGRTELEQLQLLSDRTGTPKEEAWDHLFSLKQKKQVDDGITRSFPHPRTSSKLKHILCDRLGNDQLVVALLTGLLEWDPRERLTAANALKHSYFRRLQFVNWRDIGQLPGQSVEEANHEYQSIMNEVAQIPVAQKEDDAKPAAKAKDSTTKTSRKSAGESNDNDDDPHSNRKRRHIANGSSSRSGEKDRRRSNEGVQKRRKNGAPRHADGPPRRDHDAMDRRQPPPPWPSGRSNMGGDRAQNDWSQHRTDRPPPPPRGGRYAGDGGGRTTTGHDDHYRFYQGNNRPPARRGDGPPLRRGDRHVDERREWAPSPRHRDDSTRTPPRDNPYDCGGDRPRRRYYNDDRGEKPRDHGRRR